MAFIFFRNNFKLTSTLQEYYQLPYALHPDSPIVLSFKHFKVAIHYLLASKFSDMKLLIALIFVPLHAMCVCFYPLLFLRFFSLSLSYSNLIIMCLGMVSLYFCFLGLIELLGL